MHKCWLEAQSPPAIRHPLSAPCSPPTRPGPTQSEPRTRVSRAMRGSGATRSALTHPNLHMTTLADTSTWGKRTVASCIAGAVQGELIDLPSLQPFPSLSLHFQTLVTCVACRPQACVSCLAVWPHRRSPKLLVSSRLCRRNQRHKCRQNYSIFTSPANVATTSHHKP